MDISHWDAAIHYDVQLPNIVIKPDLVTLFYGFSPCVLPYPLTEEHQSTCVDS